MGELGGLLHSWDISGTDQKKWKKLASLDQNGRTQGFAWAADEGRVVRGWQNGAGTANRGFEVLTPDLKVEKTITQGELSPGFVGTGVVCSIKFLDADRLGFDTVWFVEHHFTRGFSHSSAPCRLSRLRRIAGSSR